MKSWNLNKLTFDKFQTGTFYKFLFKCLYNSIKNKGSGATHGKMLLASIIFKILITLNADSCQSWCVPRYKQHNSLG